MTEQPTGSAASDGADPSMEEILASIRRILNDDEAPALPLPEAAAAEDEEDVLILDEAMIVAEPEAAEPEPVAAPAPAPERFEPPAVAMQPVRTGPELRPAAAIEPLGPELLGAAAAAAAASSVGSLVRTLTAGRATQVYGGGPTLEDMVRGELRPLLKDWLDTHLPPLVERLVRAEIERVVGRFVP